MASPFFRKTLFLALGAVVSGLLACSQPEAPWAPPQAGESSDFYTVTPCRLFDTRQSSPLTSGQARMFPIAGKGCNIPASAVAVAANVAVLGKDGGGLVVLRSGAEGGPLEMSFEKAGARSTHVLLPLSPDGSVTATVQGTGTAHLQLDVSGYFMPAAAPAP